MNAEARRMRQARKRLVRLASSSLGVISSAFGLSFRLTAVDSSLVAYSEHSESRTLGRRAHTHKKALYCASFDRFGPSQVRVKRPRQNAARNGRGFCNGRRESSRKAFSRLARVLASKTTARSRSQIKTLVRKIKKIEPGITLQTFLGRLARALKRGTRASSPGKEGPNKWVIEPAGVRALCGRKVTEAVSLPRLLQKLHKRGAVKKVLCTSRIVGALLRLSKKRHSAPLSHLQKALHLSSMGAASLPAPTEATVSPQTLANSPMAPLLGGSPDRSAADEVFLRRKSPDRGAVDEVFLRLDRLLMGLTSKEDEPSEGATGGVLIPPDVEGLRVAVKELLNKHPGFAKALRNHDQKAHRMIHFLLEKNLPLPRSAAESDDESVEYLENITVLLEARSRLAAILANDTPTECAYPKGSSGGVKSMPRGFATFLSAVRRLEEEVLTFIAEKEEHAGTPPTPNDLRDFVGSFRGPNRKFDLRHDLWIIGRYRAWWTQTGLKGFYSWAIEVALEECWNLRDVDLSTPEARKRAQDLYRQITTTRAACKEIIEDQPSHVFRLSDDGVAKFKPPFISRE